MLEREKKKNLENGKKKRTIEAEANSKSLAKRRHISYLTSEGKLRGRAFQTQLEAALPFGRLVHFWTFTIVWL